VNLKDRPFRNDATSFPDLRSVGRNGDRESCIFSVRRSRNPDQPSKRTRRPQSALNPHRGLLAHKPLKSARLPNNGNPPSNANRKNANFFRGSICHNKTEIRRPRVQTTQNASRDVGRSNDYGPMGRSPLGPCIFATGGLQIRLTCPLREKRLSKYKRGCPFTTIRLERRPYTPRRPDPHRLPPRVRHPYPVRSPVLLIDVGGGHSTTNRCRVPRAPSTQGTSFTNQPFKRSPCSLKRHASHAARAKKSPLPYGAANRKINQTGVRLCRCCP